MRTLFRYHSLRQLVLLSQVRRGLPILLRQPLLPPAQQVRKTLCRLCSILSLWLCLLLATTSVTVITTSQLVTDMTVITPQDFEAACQQPVAIVTTLMFVAMVPVHIIGLFALLTKVNKTFNPNFVKAKLRHNERIRRLSRGGKQ
ncbi:unnamed protein product [Rotaria socialis]|uniref:Uncharacterized protein n=1 Tax=Rotaria socialis TaxID=392032 RepID=A0A821SW47_9BILA|nr:unnamed protein product [Rotaria socialis]